MIAGGALDGTGSPPLTGASKSQFPLPRMLLRFCRKTIGLMELLIHRMQPRRAPSRMPDSPSTTASTSDHPVAS